MADIKSEMNLNEELIKGDKKCTELHYDFSRNFSVEKIVGTYFKIFAREET